MPALQLPPEAAVPLTGKSGTGTGFEGRPAQETRHFVVDWFGDPDTEARAYRTTGTATGAMRLPLVAFPKIVVRAADLLPPV